MASSLQGNVNVGQTAAQPTAEYTTQQPQQFKQPEAPQQQPLKEQQQFQQFQQPEQQQFQQPEQQQQQQQVTGQQQPEQRVTQKEQQPTDTGLNINALLEPLAQLAAWDPSNMVPSVFGSELLDPFSSLGLFDSLGNVGLPRLSNVLGSLPRPPRLGGAMARLDVGESDREFRVTADVPGVPKENIKLEIDPITRMLHISTSRREREEEQGQREGWTYHRLERTSGAAHRRVKLPPNVDMNNISATVESGVLTVTIPKVAGAESRKQIPIS